MPTTAHTIMDRSELLKHATLGGPNLDGYAYNADVYCVRCGQEIIVQVIADGKLDHLLGFQEPSTHPDFSDSDRLPQPIFFGESPDFKQHCGDCGEFMYGGE